jgi:hypothetical protein
MMQLRKEDIGRNVDKLDPAAFAKTADPPAAVAYSASLPSSRGREM